MTDLIVARYTKLVARAVHARHNLEHNERGSVTLEQAIIAAGLAALGLIVVGGIGVAVAKYMGKL
ncbi:hypothetical protein ACFV9C_41890 [Kribbella sp. NPDC059898]|uniref:hypothetical protein n=1 Tax=Kribbella sp. NPDC059898 TaxID=3346995 RepID=UPI00364BC366